MLLSRGSAWFWLKLLRKKLGSARSIFQKARFLKFTKNEPISHFYSQILTFKLFYKFELILSPSPSPTLVNSIFQNVFSKMLLMQKIFGTKDVILLKENSACLGSLLKVWKLGLAWLAGQIARLGSARLSSARLGSARLGSARLSLAQLGSALLLFYFSFEWNFKPQLGEF